MILQLSHEVSFLLLQNISFTTEVAIKFGEEKNVERLIQLKLWRKVFMASDARDCQRNVSIDSIFLA